MNTTETINQFLTSLTAADIITSSTGLLVFLIWLGKTSFGTRALINSKPRRNNMPLITPFIPLLIFFALAPLASLLTGKILKDLAEWQLVFADNIILCLVATAATAAIIILANKTFEGRLKGFGLDVTKFYKDVPAAFINLIAILPFVSLAIVLTGFLGRLFSGPDFIIKQHSELQLLITHSQPFLRIIIIITAVLVAPVFEEMLFRGLFQSLFRRGLVSPWLAVIASSALFASVHAEVSHWPALFILALCLGYSYEKSGSLFRPILIHALFNGIVIAAVLNNSNGP